jgi:Calcium-dependent channel, 7TM region, putative phosphate
MPSLVNDQATKYATPFGNDQYGNIVLRVLGRLGLDFFIFISKFARNQLDSALEGVLAETMSSTGMVTSLEVSVAPEPREIIWENAHVSRKFQSHRETISNVVLFLGVLLWSFPLAFIQAVAKIDVIAQIPGMEWLLEYDGGSFSRSVNGYLPVVALLTLIMILPVVFEYIAIKFEQRKTLSDVQASILTRYFNYQLVNIYVTVTAGSLLKTVAGIVDHPYQLLFFGAAFPSMAGTLS